MRGGECSWWALHSRSLTHSLTCRSRAGRAKVLVASDAMTRGMDVDNVQNIVNYDAPVYAKTYVHRFAVFRCAVPACNAELCERKKIQFLCPVLLFGATLGLPVS